MINIIIPSINRNTLKYTIDSLLKQTNSDWECWVGFDGFEKGEIDEKTLINDERVHYLYFPSQNNVNKHSEKPGLVRNLIIESISNNRPWIGFVDDDDMLEKHYVELVKFEIENRQFDSCVFRMRSDIGNTKITPSFLNMTMSKNYQIEENDIGISFIVNKKYITENNIKFSDKKIEQYHFLNDIKERGGKIYISNFLSYNVNGSKYCEYKL